MEWPNGQQRRAWLDRQFSALDDGLQYYLGPTGIPDKLSGLANLAAFTDAGDYVEAGEASQALWNEPSLQNAARYATAGTALALPFIGARGVNELSNNAMGFLADEDGAIRAWHGSPHDFDRFDMSKIGTGEGAQAYGHGLYFAEAESVADSYARSLGALHRGAGQAPELAKYALDAKGGDYERAANMVRAQIAGATDASPAELQELRATLYLLENKTDRLGRLYEVEINANPEDFLDWDAPLSAQPGVLNRLGYATMDEDAINAEALRIMEAQPNGAWMNDPVAKARIDELQDMLDRRPPRLTGQEFYRGAEDDTAAGVISKMTNGGFVDRAQELREAGIPGIRYLDAGSRGAGDGSRNYVVFDDQLITILKKYGPAGLASLPDN